MQFLLKKYAWVLNFLILAVIAVLAAIALNRVIAIVLAPYTVPEVTLPLDDAKTALNKPRVTRARTLAKPIISRCLFGCIEESDATDVKALECPDGCPAGEICQAGICVPPGGPGSMPILSDIDAKLMGVMVARNEQYSMAVLKQGNNTTFIIGIGESILGAQLVEIHRDRIILRRNGRLEYIKLENTIMGNPVGRIGELSRGAKDVKPTAVTGTKKSDFTAKKPTGNAPDVKKTGPNSFELDKKAVNEQLSDTKKLAGQASVVPNYDGDGKSAGIKLVGVRGGSVYSMIGIKSGDIVYKINGTKIKNQAHAFELLQTLRGSSKASIEVERKGKRETFSYQVK